MARLQSSVIILSFLVFVVPVQGVYVPEAETLSTVNVKPVCPEECECTFQKSCVFKHDKYSLDILKPWHLKRLRVYGDFKEEVDYVISEDHYSNPSLRSVINKHVGRLENEEIESVFKDMIELHINFVTFKHVLSSDFQFLENLTVLNLVNNGIKNLHSDSFSRLQKLTVLSLEDNRISVLPDGVFADLKDLKSLSLNGNDLQTLPSEVFSGMIMLENLYLQNNRIVRIENFVDNLPALTVFDIQSNRLVYILPESVEKLSTFGRVQLSGNPLQCSCVISALKTAAGLNQSVIQSDTICDGPASVKGQRLQDIDDDELECKTAEIVSVTAPSYGMYQSDITLNCSVTGSPPLGLYWITPWGDKFALPSTQLVFPNETEGALNDHEYSGLSHLLISHVLILQNGSLQINKLRGYLSGNFTCVSLSLDGGSTNKTVSVLTFSKIKTIYLTSIVIGSICAASAMIMAIFIGSVRWFVSKCMHSEGCKCCCCQSDEYDVTDKYKIEEEQTVEITYAATDSLCHDLDDSFYDPDSCPPTVPVNSPMMRMSPEKCHTPAVVDLINEEKNNPHIWGQLEEVRARLRCGAERKIEIVRSHVRSITDSGSMKIKNIRETSSLKIQSIKETGSHAALKVKKNVASGMEQVKYGVQSIKEFCGTGDMGTGTVSMVSFSTDVDTREQVKMVKSHTFV